MKSIISTFVVSSVLALGLTGVASANEAGAKNINDYLCKDILRSSGGDRDIALAFMHGYLLAKSGKDAVHRDKLSKASDDFIEACLDNPKGKAVDTLAKQLK